MTLVKGNKSLEPMVSQVTLIETTYGIRTRKNCETEKTLIARIEA